MLEVKKEDKKYKRKRLEEVVILLNDGKVMRFTSDTHFIALDDYTNFHVEPLNPPREIEYKVLRYSYAYESYILISRTDMEFISEIPVYPISYGKLKGTNVEAYDEKNNPLRKRLR